MDSKMFCFQCEQTAGCAGCTGSAGVCGKTARTARLQDELTGALIGLGGSIYAYMQENPGFCPCGTPAAVVTGGLFATVTNVDFDDEDLRSKIDQVRALKEHFGNHHGARVLPDYDVTKIWDAPVDVRSLKSLLLFGMRGMAAYAYHAQVLGKVSQEVSGFLYKGLAALAHDDWGQEELLPLVMECGKANLACMEMLDEANTGTYGTPEPTRVSLSVDAGPFVVVTGHDLHDLAQLLPQAREAGVNVYTHGEMLPAHAYPELKKYDCLKGNYGTAWQNQRDEFAGLPAPILFTTNCLMPPAASYADRVFATGPVAYPGVARVEAAGDGSKDFSALLDKAKELGGWQEDRAFTGVNGGSTVVTGFGHDAVLSHAGEVINAVKSGTVRHFFLVGGCDGARTGRNYFTEFVERTPGDSIVLTLACGKYRFNDLDLGEVGGLPRLMDMGQCNDAYGAVKVALALADAFDCGVNELPLSLVLSWYEQKAVCILLTLLYLGIKNIKLGPTLPAFVSPAVLDYLVETFGIAPVTTPGEDLAQILGE